VLLLSAEFTGEFYVRCSVRKVVVNFALLTPTAGNLSSSAPDVLILFHFSLLSSLSKDSKSIHFHTSSRILATEFLTTIGVCEMILWACSTAQYKVALSMTQS
jgi:hypothetical protein